jgi:hypothetical protein
LLIVVTALAVSAFFVGYAHVAKAYPAGGVFGRAEFNGYFTNAFDFNRSGGEVLPQSCAGAYNYFNGTGFCNAFPSWMTNAPTFISHVENAFFSGNTRARTGAAFIIQTMLSGSHSWPTIPEVQAWANLVFQYDAAGLINWNTNAYSFNLNSYFEGVDASPTPNDDAFFDENTGGLAIVFSKPSGGVAYALRRACANPVGQNSIAPLPPMANYSVDGWTTVSSPTVKPNSSVTFSHFLRNNGPTGTGDIWWIGQDMPSQATIGGPVDSGAYAPGEVKNVFNHVVNVPINAVVGSQVCERVGWDPINNSGGRNGRGPTVCATVIPDFNLTPVVIADKTNGAEGDQVTFTYQVTSSGVTPSTSVGCTPIGNTHGPGWAPLPQQDAARTADPGYAPPATNCPRVFQPNIPTNVATETITLGNLPPGSRVCRSLVVDPKNETGGPRTSAESCVIIAKTPYVRFMGNDVWAGGGFAAVNPACNTNAKITTQGRTLTSGAEAGSVGEYQVLALSQVTSFGSASKVLNGYGAVGDASRMLTFANSEPITSRLGYYGAASHCINDYSANYASSPVIGAGTYTVNGRGSGAWHVPGNLTLSGAMQAGDQQVYYVTGDVTISGDLTYPGSYATLDDIPSLLVIATGNIYVAPSVQQMDGTFVAKGDGAATGVFYTCWPKNEPLSVTHPCNATKLTVNGAVLAARLDLLRAFGATGATDAQRQEPGELFQFSPELYLRNVLNSSSGTTIETTSLLDLPPRF